MPLPPITLNVSHLNTANTSSLPPPTGVPLVPEQLTPINGAHFSSDCHLASVADNKRLPRANASRSAAADCVLRADMNTHVCLRGRIQLSQPWLMCHQVNAEPLESYQPMRFHQGYYNLNEDMGQEVEVEGRGQGAGQGGGRDTGLYLEQGSLCRVQLGVALNLWAQIKLFRKVKVFCRLDIYMRHL